MLSLLALAVIADPANASSHREAPGTALDPAADITDVYAFVSPENSDKVVLIMNVLPLQEAGGGPNYHFFDPQVTYTINISNDEDADAEVLFEFTFATSAFTQGASFLYNPGLDVCDAANRNYNQSYTLRRIDAGSSPITLLTAAPVAPSNPGRLSDMSGCFDPYDTTAGLSDATADNISVRTMGSTVVARAFAGPRQEAFYLDLGRTFDLINLGVDNCNTLLGYNVHTIALEVNADTLTNNGLEPEVGTGNNVIAVWATTTRPKILVRDPLDPNPSDLDDYGDGSTVTVGPQVQVARLGNPLVNEVVIGIEDKDLFNRAHPRDDAQFAGYVFNPILDDYLVALGFIGSQPTTGTVPGGVDLGLGCDGIDYTGDGVADPAREDIVAGFLTGHPIFGNATTTTTDCFTTGGVPFDALRLNIDGDDVGRYGAWPDGRTLEDDVVDVALSVTAGLLVDGTSLSDGVDFSNSGIVTYSTFPFMGDPWFGDDFPRAYHDGATCQIVP